MSDSAAYMCGFLAGAIVGGVSAYIILHRTAGQAVKLSSQNETLRRLLKDLEEAEGAYRTTACNFAHDHPQTARAWDRLRAAGTSARNHLFWMGRN